MSSTTPNNVDQDYAAEILKTLSEIKDFDDVQLVAELDGKKISVNRYLMSATSQYFRVLFGRSFKEGGQDEVTITGVDGPTLQLIVDFCYSGNIQVNHRNVQNIIDAAVPMELIRAEKKCEQFWINTLDTSNCLHLILTAEKYCLNDLRDKSFDFICQYFDALPASEWCEMPLSFITELLQCNQIHAREDLIFHRLVDWIEADETKRSQYAGQLLKLIHMDMLTSPALENVVEKFDCKDLSLNEYRRGDGDSDLCRCEREDAKLLLAITEDYPIENNLYSTMKIAKYNRIEDRWDHIRDIRAVKVSNPRNPIYMLHSRDNLMLINEKICMLSGLQLGRSTTEKVAGYCFDFWLSDVETHTSRLRTRPILYKNHIFVFGGCEASVVAHGALNTCLRFSLETMTVVHIASMQFRRASYAATVWNEKVYVAGGNSSDFNGRLRSVECYDLVSEEWTRIADMIYPRDFFAIVGWNGMLYAMGCHATVERYNPMRNEWTEIGTFDGSDSVTQAVVWQNEVYVVMDINRFGKFTVEPVCDFLPLSSNPFFPKDLLRYWYLSAYINQLSIKCIHLLK